MNLLTRIKFIGSIGLGVVLVGGTAGAAGGAPSGTDAPTACEDMATNDQQAAPQATEHDHHGMVAVVAEALSHVCLSDEQRAAVEQLGKQVGVSHQKVVDARHALVLTIAELLPSGHLDLGVLKPKMDALVKAQEEESPVLRKAFEELHATLDSGQRIALVDAIHAHMQEHAAKAGQKMAAFAKEYNLTDEQKTKVQDLFARAKPLVEAERAQAKAIIEAFKGDSFSIEKIAPAADVGKQAQERVDMMACLLCQLATILTPEQRADLAKKIQGKIEETPEHTTEPATGAQEPAAGQIQQGLVAGLVAVGRSAGYHAGSVSSWGRASTTSVSRSAGFVGGGYGYGPGVF